MSRLFLTVGSIFIKGLTVGLLLDTFKLRNKGMLAVIANTYTSIIRGTPVVVQLFIIYFIILAKSGLTPWLIASIAFGLNSGAYVAEIIRGDIQAVDRGPDGSRTLARLKL